MLPARAWSWLLQRAKPRGWRCGGPGHEQVREGGRGLGRVSRPIHKPCQSLRQDTGCFGVPCASPGDALPTVPAHLPPHSRWAGAPSRSPAPGSATRPGSLRFPGRSPSTRSGVRSSGAGQAALSPVSHGPSLPLATAGVALIRRIRPEGPQEEPPETGVTAAFPPRREEDFHLHSPDGALRAQRKVSPLNRTWRSRAVDNE